MTALNKQAYRADGGDIGTGRLKEIAGNAYGDEEKRWMAQRVLSLLDENLQLQRDKDSLEAVAIAMRDDMRDAREKLEAAEKRIAELSASHSKLRDTMTGIHNTIRMDGGYTPLAAILNAAKRAHEESATAAGIGVKEE
ncbi:TPA: ead/Ea22-like family protein [Citrobacter braakii]|nr:ead/Ea22-like family protein [Citrobacter braakii]